MVEPPGVPTIINNAYSFSRMVGVIELSIRLPGSIAFPPRFMISTPTSEARGWAETTIARSVTSPREA